MATLTQYNPNVPLNACLFEAGASKTVYALVRPEIEDIRENVLGSILFGDLTKARADYLTMFRDAWTSKQDAFHEDFFKEWVRWSAPVVEDIDRHLFSFYYPTAGASEGLRHLIYSHAAKGGQTIHVFEGEYEGYKAMAEAAGLKVVEWQRDGRDGWHTPFGGRFNRVASNIGREDIFLISQPSAIDGNVWPEFNEFISKMPNDSVIVDLTYVGAVPQYAIIERFNANQPAVRNIVFSLSKPFGVYYDRIGGVFAKTEDLGLFGNKWFKNLTSLALGTELLQQHQVFDFVERTTALQREACKHVGERLNIELTPSHVSILATAPAADDDVLNRYLIRAGKIRLCLTPYISKKLGTSGSREYSYK